ncbi:nSTAND3 domain-containing NTPase [Sphingopyxis fribergensis]
MTKAIPKNSASTQKSSRRGGAAALLGFDYQLDVSVLAAVQLLLVSKAADRLVLEPANEEDLEADLADFVPGRVEPSAAMAGGYKLVVQVKLSGGEPWSIEDFKKLLKHGSDKPGGRRKALHHLDDPNTRYLLVTSADAKGVMRKLLVEGFEEASDRSGFPQGLRATLEKAPEGRVAIWGKLTTQQLASEIREKFSDILHVAKVDQTALLSALRAEAALRMRSLTPGIWTREDLLAVVRKHGGFLSSSADLDQFVPPQNYRAFTAKLKTFGAVVIRGSSGTGKTETARKLCEWARVRDGSLEVVTLGASDTPSAARKLVNNGPTLFYVDDPWGQYSLSGGADAWTEQLPRLLRKANAGHQFVITSRTDMMERGDVNGVLDPWAVDLESTQYENGQLGEIYDRRMVGLSPALQSTAYAFRGNVLDKLKTPLEIDIYFQHLQVGPQANETDSEFYHRLLQIADREAVTDVIVKTLASQGSTGSSASVWALLAARGQLERGSLVALQRALRKHDSSLSDGLEKLVDRMIAGRFLRQPARTISFAHPSAREGFEAYVEANWLQSETALETLVSALTQMPEAHAGWGTETAARIFKLTRDFSERIGSDFAFEIDRQSQGIIDAWLDACLTAKGSDFLPLLELASEVGSRNSVGSCVANWLLKGVKRGSAWFIDDWSPPEYDEAWYDAVSEHPIAVKVADRFVREVLAFDRGGYDATFVTELDRIAAELTPAYIAAALTMVGNGFETNADTVAAGAVRDLTAFDAVVHAALDDLGSDYRRWVAQDRAEYQAIEDGERDASAEEAMRWHHEGQGYTSGVFVSAYIRTLRSTGRWNDVAQYPRVKEMIRPWANAILVSSAPPGLDELRAFLRAANGHKDEADAWAAARQHWQAGLEADLASRLRDKVEDVNLREELVLCCLAHAPQCLSAAFEAFSARPHLQITLIADLHRAADRLDAEEAGDATIRAVAQLTPAMQEIAAAMPTKHRGAKAVELATLAVLTAEAAKLDSQTLSQVVPAMIASNGDASGAVRYWLEIATTQEHARAAAEAAVAIDDAASVTYALGHARADARVAALRHLAGRLPTPLPAEFLRFETDPSHRVRDALVTILGGKPHSQHLDALLALTSDTWSSAEPEHDETESYDVARAAVVALQAYAPLSIESGKILLRLADQTQDRTLSRYALTVAANHCSAAIQQDIWDLVNLPASRWIRVDAFEALASAETLDPDIVAQITAAYIFAAPPILAVSAADVLGKHADFATAQLIFAEVANANSWRALLLVGATALASRDLSRARLVLDLLGPHHPARQILDEGKPLPPAIFDDLGDVRLRKIVHARFGNRIAAEKNGP